MTRPSLFMLHLPLEPITSAPGGAAVWSGHTVCNIEPYGVLRFAEESRDVTITESDTDNVEVSISCSQLDQYRISPCISRPHV